MGSPTLGEIRMFGGSFAPVGWAFCNGQHMPIAENESLYILLGTKYGGDGQQTFGLPNLQGRVPIHMGTNPGTGTNFQIGQAAGVENVTLTVNQIPGHIHPMLASSGGGTLPDPNQQVIAASPSSDLFIQDVTAVNLNATAISLVGGSQPHENIQPYLCISFIISLFGVFPSQN